MTATYSDSEEYFEQALASERGIAVDFATAGQATNFMQKLNSFRVKQRKTNSKVYPDGHPLHNRTPWDNIIVRKDPADESRTTVLLQPAKLEVKGVRTL